MSDIQIAINNRPLTYTDQSNSLEILTPNHLISSGPSFPTLIISEDNLNDDMDEEDMRDAILHTLELRDVLISRFSKEFFHDYLLSMREKHRGSYVVEECIQSAYLKVGAVVLIKHPVKP